MAKQRKLKGLNKHQKAQFRPGEHRVRREGVLQYIEMAYSHDADERLEAADNLCPCHVRTRVEAAWEALYRMMEDDDVRVRRAAWHTLEDGGCPDDPRLDALFERAMANETDTQVRRFVEMFALPHFKEKEQIAFQKASREARDTRYNQRGRCDFCGESSKVRTDFDTELSGSRFALVCESCDVVMA